MSHIEHPDAQAYREAARENLNCNDFEHRHIDASTAVEIDPTGKGAHVQVWVWVAANDTELPLCPACQEYRLPDGKEFCEDCLPPKAAEHITQRMARHELVDAYDEAHGVGTLDETSDDALRQLVVEAFAEGYIDEADIGLPARRKQ